ncbi:adhesion G protein-coupled receptor L4-like [Pocillopora damicornis]|uniref:adhesion G protein-coupled receptor L4-like n=1 Tax=Pocillopora damicornis TaxID=46731 RepID=UPI000F5566C9|nr:adhesion G protein-coupled receptor L4-like [Pocillopora damicornis]
MSFQLMLTSMLFLAELQKANGAASYTGKNSFHRWSDAVTNCKRNGGGFLAKIKSSAELQKARTAFLQYQDPKEYWIGIKYDTTKGDFVWGDGTLVTATTAFETIVNRVEQQSDTDKRCLYLSTQDVLVAADCEAHKKYICQVGETADPVETTAATTAVPKTTTAAKPTTTTTIPTTTTNIKARIGSSLPLTSMSSLLPVSSRSVSLTPLLQSTYLSVSSTNLLSSSLALTPSKTLPTITAITASHTPSLVEEYANEIEQLNASEPSSLENAVNLTSTLVRKASTADSKVNILVSFEKLEVFAMNYASLHLTPQNGSEREISIEQKELGMSVMRVSADHKSGVVFPSHANTFNESFIQEEKGAITLSASMFNQDRYVVCALYKNAADLMPEGANNVNNRKKSTIRTRIISCTVKPEVRGNFEEDVVINLTNTKDNLTATQTSCVFWNFSISTKFDGAWSQKGCKLVQETKERTTCSCNHLTNFAVLMEVGETKISDDHKFALTLVTYIGLSLSLIGETITILVYLVLMNLKSSQSHIRLNLVMCLVIAQLVFMTGIQATQMKTLCAIVAITINYFYLVAFAWMVTEGVMLYLKVVKVFNVDTSTKIFYALAWGVPTLVVASALGITVILDGSTDNSMRDDVCWFAFSSGFMWAFVGSVLLACLVSKICTVSIRIHSLTVKG